MTRIKRYSEISQLSEIEYAKIERTGKVRGKALSLCCALFRLVAKSRSDEKFDLP